MKEYDFSFFIKAYPSVHFRNDQLKQIIRVIGSDFGSTGDNFSIIIEKKSLFSLKAIDISDYYGTFGDAMMKGKNYSLRSQAEFIQQHLMPVVRGEMWIDELMSRSLR